MAREDNFAILVGVGDYPEGLMQRLDGPGNDVDFFADWLADPVGGNLPVANIRKLVSPQQRNGAPPHPPSYLDFWQVLKSIVIVDQQLKRRPGRLYLFFSGHGFCDFKERTNHAALYTADATPASSANVCGTFVADWCQRSAVFEEIMLVMDCCRDKEMSKPLYGMLIDEFHDPNRAKHVSRFDIYAVPYDGKAQERHFEAEGKRHGLLTYALVHALRSAPLRNGPKPGDPAVRNTAAIKEFIEGVWGTLLAGERVESPEFGLPRKGDLLFPATPPRPLKRKIRLSTPLTTPAALHVIDDAKQDVSTVDLELDAQAVTLELPIALYEIVLERDGLPNVSTTLPMMGVKDVVLEI
ncbi:MAG: caspase family protein [Lysobacterales bacterium]